MKEMFVRYKYQIIVLGIFCLELVLFRTDVQREIIGKYPTYNDQAVFMTRTYHMYGNIVDRDFQSVLHEITAGLGQGAFPIFGVIFLFLFGNSRLSLLLVNFTLYLCAQLVGYYSVKKMSNSNKAALTFVGLFMMIQSPFYYAGGLLDYRMDFSGSCLYTCWISLFVLAHYKKEKKDYYLSAFFAGMCLMFRSNTIAYMAVAFVLFECVHVFVLKQEKFYKEIRNLVRYGCVVILGGGWYLLVQIKSLYNYYATAHVTSVEPKIRMIEQGITDWLSYIKFYPMSLIKDHLGVVLSSILLIVIFVSIVILTISRKTKGIKLTKNEWSALCAGGFGFLAPFIVLTIDVSKSSVVICTVSGAAVLIAMYFVSVLKNKQLLYGRTVGVLSFLAVLCGLVNYTDHTTEIPDGYDRTDQKEMLAINHCMENYLIENDLDSAKLLVDKTYDGINHNVLTVLTYEDENRFMYISSAWQKIEIYAEYTEEEVYKALEIADLMVLSEDYEYSYYPADASLDKYRDLMWKYAEENLIKLGEYNLHDNIIAVFGKGQVKINTAWSEWMSDENNTVSFTKFDQGQKAIHLLGNTGGGFSSPDEVHSIVLEANQLIPSEIKINDTDYEIVIDISEIELGRHNLELEFDNYFIPKELNINEDTRKLVLMSPNRVSVD